jgi:hypothetical protein
MIGKKTFVYECPSKKVSDDHYCYIWIRSRDISFIVGQGRFFAVRPPVPLEPLQTTLGHCATLMTVVKTLSIFGGTRKGMERGKKRHTSSGEGNGDGVLEPCEVVTLYLWYSLLAAS